MSYSKNNLDRLLADVIANRVPISDVKTVLDAGADPNKDISKGHRPLHYAAYENYVEAMQLLVERGANVNCSDDLGYTPLHIACKHGKRESVRFLIKQGAIINFSDDTFGASKTSKILAYFKFQPLYLAVENNHPDIVELLLEHGANPNRKYFLGYEINLVSLEYPECLDLMLQYGADPNAVSRGGLTVLMKACKLGISEAIKVLLRHNADVNQQCPPKFDQKTALHFAAMTGNVEICQLLLDAGALTIIPEGFGYSPLEYAVTQDKLDVVRLLLSRGADCNEINSDKCCPLQVACSAMGLKYRKDIIQLLLQYGGDPNYNSGSFSYVNPSLSALVEYFTYNDEYDYSIVRLIIEYGANVNMTSPTRLFRIRNAFGVLGQVRKLRPYEDIFNLLVEACEFFDREAIQNESSLSNRQKVILLEACESPLDLKHLARIKIRHSVHFPKPILIENLFLPEYLKKYLLFRLK